MDDFTFNQTFGRDWIWSGGKLVWGMYWEKSYNSMNTDPVNPINTIKQLKKKAWTKNLEEILDKAMKSIDMNNYEHPIGKLDTTFHKPAGKSNLYVWFKYGPHTIFEYTWGQVSGSMNSHLNNTNKQVQQSTIKTWKQKLQRKIFLNEISWGN